MGASMVGRGVCFKVYANDSPIYHDRICNTPCLKQIFCFHLTMHLTAFIINSLRPPEFSFLMKMGLTRSSPPFSLEIQTTGKQSSPFQFPTGEGLAELWITFRSLKMIRSANGCLEPIKFTRISNHFQTQEGWALEGLQAVRLPQQREKTMLSGGRRLREWMAPLCYWGTWATWMYFIGFFFTIKGLYDSLIRPMIQR